MAIPKIITEDGFETQFGVNYLGHFALTGQLLEVLLKTEPGNLELLFLEAAIYAGTGNTDVGLPGLSGSVYHTSHYCNFYRRNDRE